MRFVNCSYNEFKLRVNNRRIYCFGYGGVAKLFLNILQEDNITDNIVTFIDNNPNKIGKKQINNGLEYSISSVEVLRKIRKDECILITCSDVTGVIAQLKLIDELNDIECYSMHLILSREDSKVEYNEITRRCDEQRIPSIIHYCWFGGKPIPDLNKRWIESWHKYCPNYQIVEWNENNYDISKNSYINQAYESEKWGFVADYARLDIIYNEGGIYLDTDIELVSNLDDLLYQEAFSIFDVQRHVNLGNGFGAPPGHSLIKELRDYYDGLQFIDSHGKCDLTTCVMHQYNVLKKYGFKPNGQYQIIQGMTIFPEQLNGIDAYSHIKTIRPCTKLMHYGTASWSTSVLSTAREKRIKFMGDMLQNENICNNGLL